jgi:YHS domain-containing protein
VSAFTLSLRAADEPGKDVKCPVSGKAVKADKTVDFNGGKVYFCCENCPKAFQADTAKYAAKANHQLVQTGQLKQVACPLTGKPTKDEQTVEIDGVKVAFCCGNCKGKVAKASGDEQLNLVFGDTSKGFKPAKEAK